MDSQKPDALKTATEEEKLKHEIQKLIAETENLRSGNRWERRVGRYVPFLTALVAVAGFLLGIYQFGRQQTTEIEKLKLQQSAEIEALRSQFENNTKLSEKEFRRRFYEKQLDAYFDVSKTVAQMVTVQDPREVDKLHTHFLELYNSSLIIVQERTVKEAAEKFEGSFKEYRLGRLSRDELQETARRLSRACRNSLLHIWDIKSLPEDNGD